MLICLYQSMNDCLHLFQHLHPTQFGYVINASVHESMHASAFPLVYKGSPQATALKQPTVVSYAAQCKCMSHVRDSMHPSCTTHMTAPVALR